MATRRIETAEDPKYTDYLPEHLRERYEKGLADSQLLHLRREIALLDVRIKLLVENLDHQVLEEDEIERELASEFPALDRTQRKSLARYVRSLLPETFIDHRTFKRLERLIERHEESLASGRVAEARRSLDQVFRAIREGRRDGDVWDQISETTEQRRRLVEAEERRLQQADQLVAVDKVVMLLAATIEAIRLSVNKYVTDKEIRSYILVDAERTYARLLGDGEDPPSNARRLDG